MNYVAPAKRPRETTTFDRRLTKRLLDAAHATWGVRPNIIQWGGRQHSVLRPRWAVMYALRQLDWSYPRIGHLFEMDHTTVMNAVAKCQALMDENPVYRDLVNAMALYAQQQRVVLNG